MTRLTPEPDQIPHDFYPSLPENQRVILWTERQKAAKAREFLELLIEQGSAQEGLDRLMLTGCYQRQPDV